MADRSIDRSEAKMVSTGQWRTMLPRGDVRSALAPLQNAFAASLVLLLAACMGSETDTLPAPSTAVNGCTAAVPSSPVCPTAAAKRQVSDVRRAAVSAPGFADALAWAEATFPQFFPGPRTDLSSSGPYLYRYYPSTGNYLGFAGTSVYILGPVSDGVLQYVGELTDYADRIDSWKGKQGCTTGVSSGYSGDYSDHGGAGGGPGDGDGDGAAGDGGYFINTPVVVELADGSVLGQASTDSVKGMVTICGGRTGQPVKITFMGSPQAQYFDEAKGQLVPFLPGETMHVVVPQITKNIGATAFTEAAYQYLLTKHGPDGWRDPGKVEEANAMVLQEINRGLRDSLAVTDITRLTIAFRGPNTSTIDTGSNGVYSMVNSGLAFAAGTYNRTVANPATEARTQLARDLTDGVIDGRDSSGASVAGPSGNMYDAANLRDRWLQGANQLAQGYGNAAAIAATSQTTRVTSLLNNYIDQSKCPPSASDVFPGQYWLDSSGQVTANFDLACVRSPQRVSFPTRVIQMFQGPGADVFFLLADGTVYAMGRNKSGTLGMHDTLPRFVPTLVAGISNIANMSVGNTNVVAITSSGEAYAWGGFNIRAGGTAASADYRPEKISGLPRAVMGASTYGVIAVLGVDGLVYTLGTYLSDSSGGNNVNEWGLYGDGSPVSAAPRLIPQPIPLSEVTSIATSVPDASYPVQDGVGVFLVTRRDGSVWMWGNNYYNDLGTVDHVPAIVPMPSLVKSLGAIPARQVGCSLSICFALLNDGSIWTWGGGFGGFPSLPPHQVAFPPGVLAYKSLQQGGGALALSGDGRLYDFTSRSFLEPPDVGVPPPIGSPSATVTTFAGGAATVGKLLDGVGSAAGFSQASGIAVDDGGNVYVTDTHAIRKITPSGVVSTFAGNGTPGFVDGTGADARFSRPSSLAVDRNGTVYVADTGNNAIRKITSTGVVTTLAGGSSAGATDGSVGGATFNFPLGVAVDGVGNVYVADASNRSVRKVSAAGVVTTIARGFEFPMMVAVDSAGNVFVSDTNAFVIKKVTPTGEVSTFAGSGIRGFLNGGATDARFAYPDGLAVDSSGNVFVADMYNNVIRKITPAGFVTTLAGTGGIGMSDGTGATATFGYPYGVAVTTTGLVYVVEVWGVRKIVP